MRRFTDEIGQIVIEGALHGGLQFTQLEGRLLCYGPVSEPNCPELHSVDAAEFSGHLQAQQNFGGLIEVYDSIYPSFDPNLPSIEIWGDLTGAIVVGENVEHKILVKGSVRREPNGPFDSSLASIDVGVDLTGTVVVKQNVEHEIIVRGTLWRDPDSDLDPNLPDIHVFEDLTGRVIVKHDAKHAIFVDGKLRDADPNDNFWGGFIRIDGGLFAPAHDANMPAIQVGGLDFTNRLDPNDAREFITVDYLFDDPNDPNNPNRDRWNSGARIRITDPCAPYEWSEWSTEAYPE